MPFRNHSDRFEVFNQTQAFLEEAETLPPRLSKLYCKNFLDILFFNCVNKNETERWLFPLGEIASRPASTKSCLRSSYFLPTIGYSLGIINRLSSVIFHDLITHGEITAAAALTHGRQAEPDNHQVHLDVINEYQHFFQPIQLLMDEFFVMDMTGG
ncbi:hypothetical protein DL95DRAFT_416828 [Leptodontidium sp. 2 PMI_412]|nr:hypothetical protein DL95DRAFT_416828 [Leptodontidium sp. 2 PMI_412]